MNMEKCGNRYFLEKGRAMPMYYSLKGSTFRSAIGIHTLEKGEGTFHGGVRVTQPILRFYNNNPNIG